MVNSLIETKPLKINVLLLDDDSDESYLDMPGRLLVCIRNEGIY